LYGIASRVSSDVEEWQATREAAEAALAQVLAYETGPAMFGA